MKMRIGLIASTLLLIGWRDTLGQVNPDARQGPSQPSLTTDLRHRAEQGEAEAQYQLAVQLSQIENPEDSAEAPKWFRKAAEQGHAQAQAQVGELYLLGMDGVDKDLQQAITWFRKAAEQGDALGQAELAFMYETGAGVPQNYAEAVRWYTRAADQGLPLAQFDLAYMYENGRGVTADIEKAVHLYELAALGVPTARHNLAVLYLQGGGSVRKDPVLGYKWAVLAVSAEVQRLFHERKVDQEHRLGHALIFVEDIAKSINNSQKRTGYRLAEEWINSNASHLGEEPRMFTTATKKFR